MRKLTVAALAAVLTTQFAAPALAADVFNRTTMLGWRHHTGPAVVAYLRAPIGPSGYKAKARTGIALTGPRAYGAGAGPLFSAGPTMLDVALVPRGVGGRWSAQVNIGNAVAWTNDEKSIEPGRRNLMESGISWVVVGAATVALAAGTFAFIENDN